MNRQMDIQRIVGGFKGIRNIPVIKSAKKRVLITKIKKRQRGKHHIKLYEDNKKDESEQELGEDENYSSTDLHNNNTEETTRIPEITQAR